MNLCLTTANQTGGSRPIISAAAQTIGFFNPMSGLLPRNIYTITIMIYNNVTESKP